MNKKERVICELEVDFKESFCCCFNLSNDNIISAYASFKTGVDFRGQVLKRMRKMTIGT